MSRSFSLLLLVLATALFGARRASAQSTVFVVRHCDRGPEEPDAALTPKGLRQAEVLGAMLADAKLTRIFTTELTRTQQTAAPAAKRAGVAPEVVAQTDFDGLITRVRAGLRAGEATLVVGHRGTVPRIVKALAGADIPPLASDEFTRIVVLTLFSDGRSTVVTLRLPGPASP